MYASNDFKILINGRHWFWLIKSLVFFIRFLFSLKIFCFCFNLSTDIMKCVHCVISACALKLINATFHISKNWRKYIHIPLPHQGLVCLWFALAAPSNTLAVDPDSALHAASCCTLFCFSTTCCLQLNVVLAVSTVCLMSFYPPSCLRAYIGPQGCNIFQGMYAFRMPSASACLACQIELYASLALAFCIALSVLRADRF